MNNFFDDYYSTAHKRPAYVAAGVCLALAKNIEALMNSQGITNSDLAVRLGCSKAYVTKLLRGDANLTVNTIAKISIALDAEFNFAMIQKSKYKEMEKFIKAWANHFPALKESQSKSAGKHWISSTKCSNDEIYGQPLINITGIENAQLRFA
jgi:transcriptional regulator with XRE-family HTH domain